MLISYSEWILLFNDGRFVHVYWNQGVSPGIAVYGDILAVYGDTLTVYGDILAMYGDILW